jgi:hypothetical protein
MCVNLPWEFAIEDKTVSRDVGSDSHEGSCIRVLRDLNLASISMFMFVICVLGFDVSSCGDVGFDVSLGSILIVYDNLVKENSVFIIYTNDETKKNRIQSKYLPRTNS